MSACTMGAALIERGDTGEHTGRVEFHAHASTCLDCQAWKHGLTVPTDVLAAARLVNADEVARLERQAARGMLTARDIEEACWALLNT